ncbi:MAG: S8 family peptidase [Patescibacteria group bacterium]
MKTKKILLFLIIGIILFSFLVTTVNAVIRKENRKIVVFKPGILNEAAEDELIAQTGGIKLKNLDLIGAKVVLLPSKAAENALLSHPAVLRIDDDVEVFALEQVLPWGIARIKANQAWNYTTGNGIKVGIIDTGIQLNHPDLANNIKGGYNAINPKKSANDDNGHGTHVAGIVAAIYNNIGVVGASHQAWLYAIKVLNASGSGYLSDVIEGIEWAINHNLQVINLSLGTSSNVQSFHDAIISAKNAGLVVVAAAGNNGGSVLYPAAYPETIAVSAIDENNVIASWSNRGPEIDLSAPGVNIYSTYKKSRYATMSGTSMAAPHVTGAVALLLTRIEKCDTNNDGKCSPDEVQTRLQNTALDLGEEGFDPLYGWGLVDALAAIE